MFDKLGTPSPAVFVWFLRSNWKCCQVLSMLLRAFLAVSSVHSSFLGVNCWVPLPLSRFCLLAPRLVAYNAPGRTSRCLIYDILLLLAPKTPNICSGCKLGRHTMHLLLSVPMSLSTLVDWKWSIVLLAAQMVLDWNHALLPRHGMLISLGVFSLFLAYSRCPDLVGLSCSTVLAKNCCQNMKIWIPRSAALARWL